MLIPFADPTFAPRAGNSRREEEGEPAEVTRCDMSDTYNKVYDSQHSALSHLFWVFCYGLLSPRPDKETCSM